MEKRLILLPDLGILREQQRLYEKERLHPNIAIYRPRTFVNS